MFQQPRYEAPLKVPLFFLLLPTTILAEGSTPTPDLAKTSPFVSSAKPQGTAPIYPIQLAGFSSSNGKTILCIYDSRVKQTHWIAIGETAGGITAVSFDADTQQAVIALNSVHRTLVLRNAAVLPQGTETAADIKRQQAEARMLVSDLLDIGMEQRRAYDKAAQKAEKPKKSDPQP